MAKLPNYRPIPAGAAASWRPPGSIPGAPGSFNPTGNPTEILKKYDDQISRTNSTLKGLELQLRMLKKPHSKDKKGLAAYTATKAKITARIAEYKASLKSLTDKRAGAQNKVWESSGQYENLLKGTERDAFMAINALFKNYGLETLAGKIYDYVKNGYSADTISILLQDTQEYKSRFAGNEARKKAGLPVLSPGEYLATESSFRQIMQQAGLPAGFYDQPSDFNTWIGKNVSPSEIQTRVDLASQATVLANPDYKRALNMMGISDGEMTAYFLNPDRALPYLQKSAATAAIGGQALAQGLTFDQAYSEQLALQGISQEEAQQGYSMVAQELETMQNLGKIYGESWNQRSSEEALFEGSGEALKKKGRLLSAERGAFAGGTGGARAGLGQRGGAR